MRTEYKFEAALPYSLHDMRVSSIRIIDDDLHFTFENKEFLLRVVEVLENIVIDGGSNSPVTIDIKDCEIVNSNLFSDITT